MKFILGELQYRCYSFEAEKSWNIVLSNPDPCRTLFLKVQIPYQQ